MGKTADRQKYIHNLAGTIMGGNYVYPKDAEELFRWYSVLVSEKLRQFSDQTLGKIVACGISAKEAEANKKTSVFQVQGFEPLQLNIDGRSLLLEIAVTAVIAAMMDIIRARARRG
jgi:curved DNA-binding protein CbpA